MVAVNNEPVWVDPDPISQPHSQANAQRFTYQQDVDAVERKKDRLARRLIFIMSLPMAVSACVNLFGGRVTSSLHDFVPFLLIILGLGLSMRQDSLAVRFISAAHFSLAIALSFYWNGNGDITWIEALLIGLLAGVAFFYAFAFAGQQAGKSYDSLLQEAKMRIDALQIVDNKLGSDALSRPLRALIKRSSSFLQILAERRDQLDSRTRRLITVNLADTQRAAEQFIESTDAVADPRARAKFLKMLDKFTRHLRKCEDGQAKAKYEAADVDMEVAIERMHYKGESM